MKQEKTPFACHVFVCVNDRQGCRKSCADDHGQEIKDLIKSELKKKHLPAGSVRVTQSGCLGICDSGPNVMVYPQEILFTGVTVQDVLPIVDEIEALLNQC